MNKQIIVIPGLFALGILVGITVMHYADDGPTVLEERPSDTSDDADLIEQVPVDWLADELELLNRKLEELSLRLEAVESEIADPSDEPAVTAPHRMSDNAVTTTRLATARNRTLSADNLMRAGLDFSVANDIVRRKNQLELDKLELRDAAVRGGYLGSERYMDELQQLQDTDVSLRDELGDDVYDRYLFTNGQTNRIRVASVMAGSAAEESGVADNDLVISYDQQRMFQYTELQQATTQGDREEFVSMMVERDGQQLMLWVPRGPLGVRLTMIRVDPDQ